MYFCFGALNCRNKVKKVGTIKRKRGIKNEIDIHGFVNNRETVQ